MSAKGLARAAVAESLQIWKELAAFRRVVLVVLLLVGAVTVFAATGGIVQEFTFRHMSPREHLKLARDACGISGGEDGTRCLSPSDAVRQLQAIPASAAEYGVASRFLQSVTQKASSDQTAQEELAAKYKAEPYEKVRRNLTGEAHDQFSCSTSAQNHPILSFDGGLSWWTDDGRCAAQLQKQLDSDAERGSYISSTIRVDTDIDGSWLADEERTCRTYPDEKGEVAVVACDEARTEHKHNIPVKFWGGLERNKVSDWKCRREKDFLRDEMTCRAIN